MGEEGRTLARHFGDNMRRLRKRAGISQEALGERASLHRTEIGLIERGARCPRIDTLLKIAAGLGVDLDCELFEGISWERGETTASPGAFTFSPRADVGERAAALRARQAETTDAVQLVREGREERMKRHDEAMRLAAEAREGQTETVDAAKLIREVRDEMEGDEQDEARRGGDS